MAVNRGKEFEGEIRKAFLKCPDLVIERYPDPTMGYLGIRNFCDFMVYKYPFQYFFECKSVNGNTLNFQSGITENQWNGLLEKSKIKGVAAGIIIWFIKQDFTSFIPITELQILKGFGEKSVHIDLLLNNDIRNTPFKGRKKRVFFEYDAMTFTKEMEEYQMAIWRVKWQKINRRCL